MTKPAILLIAGHRSVDDHGNTDETRMTGVMVRAYRDVLTGGGYAVTTIPADQYLDPNGPEMPGGLDDFGRQMAAWAARTAGPKVLLDLHFGGEPVGGCFVIVPDVTGLSSAAPGWFNAADTWENNTLDRTFGRKLVDYISTITGMPQRTVGVRENGIMDESQTGVGLDGWRLATFAYTAPYQANLVRLVVEQGNLNPNAPNQRDIVFRPDFPGRVADACMAALSRVYDVATVPVPTPEPPHKFNPKTVWPKQTAGKIGQVWETESAKRRSWGRPDPECWGAADGYGGTLYLFTDGLLLRRDDDSGAVTRI